MSLPGFASRRAFWVCSYIVWFTVLNVLSSRSTLPSIEIDHIDKVEHCLYFLAGGICLGLAISIGSKPRWLRIFAIVVMVGIAVGALDEWHQSFVPGRSGNDLGDLLADALGTLLSCIALPTALRLVSK